MDGSVQLNLLIALSSGGTEQAIALPVRPGEALQVRGATANRRVDPDNDRSAGVLLPLLPAPGCPSRQMR